MWLGHSPPLSFHVSKPCFRWRHVAGLVPPETGCSSGRRGWENANVALSECLQLFPFESIPRNKGKLWASQDASGLFWSC